MSHLASTLDLSSIGRRAVSRRDTLRDTPTSLVNALKLAREMIYELDDGHDEGRPRWCTPAALDAVLACAMTTAIHLETLSRELVMEDDSGLPASIQ